MKLKGIIKNNTNTGDFNDGLWGIETKDGFLECGDLLGELDIFLANNNQNETKQGNRIEINIE